tara:strand:+ start:1686 stop:1934 length:249 start_codon:yes stop_codon:yes gene_type:complete
VASRKEKKMTLFEKFCWLAHLYTEVTGRVTTTRDIQPFVAIFEKGNTYSVRIHSESFHSDESIEDAATRALYCLTLRKQRAA